MSNEEKNMPVVHRISNPFSPEQNQAGVELAHSQGTALMAAEVQRGIAEVQASYLVAQNRPRNQIAATDRMLNECQRPSLAEQAVYSFPRGGIEVTGPTIRLAEMLARNWGNIKCGWRCLDRKPGRSLIQAFAIDLETNFGEEVVFEVTHFRDVNKKDRQTGKTQKIKVALTDERDIYEMEANQAARRLRKCILTVIPGDIIDLCLDQCELTLSSTASNTPESIQKLLTAFKAHGVNKAMIEARLQRKLESITQAQVANFKKIYTSLKDGMSSASDWFDMSLADKEPVDTVLNEGSAQGPKKRGRKPKSDKEQTPAQTKAEENKASDTQEFNKKQLEKAQEPEEEPKATESEKEPETSTSAEVQEIKCTACNDTGTVFEVDEFGEELSWPCTRCAHMRK